MKKVTIRRVASIAIPLMLAGLAAPSAAQASEGGGIALPMPDGWVPTSWSDPHSVIVGDSVVVAADFTREGEGVSLVWRLDEATSYSEPEIIYQGESFHSVTLASEGRTVAFADRTGMHLYNLDEETMTVFPIGCNSRREVPFAAAMSSDLVAFRCLYMSSSSGDWSQTVQTMSRSTGEVQTHYSARRDDGYEYFPLNLADDSISLDEGSLAWSFGLGEVFQRPPWIDDQHGRMNHVDVTGTATASVDLPDGFSRSVQRMGVLVTEKNGELRLFSDGRFTNLVSGRMVVADNGIAVGWWPQELPNGVAGRAIRFMDTASGAGEWVDLWSDVAEDQVDGRRVISNSVLLDAGDRTEIDHPVWTGTAQLSAEPYAGQPVIGGSDVHWLSDVTLSYAWYLNGVLVPGNDTDTYVPSAEDGGLPIVFEVTAVSGSGNVAVLQTAPALIRMDPPVNLVAPSLVAAVAGTPITGSIGQWEGASGYYYGWYLNGELIDGADQAVFTPDDSMVGGRLQFEVTAVNVAGDPVAVVSQAATVVASGR